MTDLSPGTLKFWLEWAGARLVAMPSTRIKPQEPRALWPDYGQDLFQVLDFRGGLQIRIPAPPPNEIDLAEEILTLPVFCKRIPVRRTILIRTLVHPISNRNLYAWRKIAIILNSDVKTVRGWFKSGLIEIVEKAPTSRIEEISSKMNGHVFA